MNLKNNLFRWISAGVLCCLVLPLSLRAQSYNYAEVLQKSMFFFECQESALGPNNRVTWRGDAAMNDGSDVGHDLTGGWFDAGDHVKFNFPMAFSATALAWGAIEFEQGYISSGQMPYLKRNLRYVNDYFIKCHTAPNELWGQVGNGGADHAWWGPAEVMKMARPAYKIDAANPGSDLAGETAAAMAAASIVFRNDDPAYANELLQHAEQLYSFADNYRGAYSESITDAAGYYRSYSGYNDELIWGAIWLYKATGDQAYLDKAEIYFDELAPEEGQEGVHEYKWTIAWDDKMFGSYVLLAQITGDEKYKIDAERNLDYWTDGWNGNRINYTPGGLAFLDIWGSLRYAMNESFLALVYADLATTSAKSDKYNNFARSQLMYALGDNPQNRSYVCGFGLNPPVEPHHRTAHGGWSNNQNGPPEESRHILYGALVGGPGDGDDYTDERSNYTNNEVACDYNALFSGVLAAFVEREGGTPLSNFPVPETPTDEYFIEAKSNSSGDQYSEWAVWTYNHTAWPAREGNEYKFRLYIDISEGQAAGYSAADYIVSSNNTGVVSFTDLIPWDEGSLYYTEVTYLPDVEIWPGGQQYDKKEAQMRIRLPYDAPASAWDPSNDPAWEGITGILQKMPTIPMYVDGERVYGSEPEGGNSIPAESVSVSPATATLDINETVELSATVLPVDATNKNVNWTSSSNVIASVSSAGVVTALAPGEATITVTTVSGGHTDVALITVSEPPYVEVSDVILSSSTIELDVNESATLTATILPANATDQSLTWSSSAPSIASVNASGVVTGISEGSAVITVNTSNPAVSATCDVTVTDVVVEPTYFDLLISVTGQGSVVLNPAGGTYEEGTVVTLTASPAAGYQFENWSGDASGSNISITITMDADKSVTANFSPSGGGNCSNPMSISLPFQQNGAGEYCYFTDGTISYINSWNMQVVEVNGVDMTNVWSNNMPARQDGGYYIYYQANVGWAHMEIDGTDDSTEPEIYTLNTSVTGQGSVSPADGSYEEGTLVTLTATPAAGWVFDGWSGDASGTSPSVSVTMDSDKSVSAAFIEDIEPPVEYELTVSVTGQGSVSPAGGTFEEGTVVTLTATPAAGWVFDGWSGDASGTSQSVSVTMDSDKSVSAAFIEDIEPPVEYELTVSVTGQGSVSPAGGTFEEGTLVTLTATPAAGWLFDGWSGDASGTSSSVSVTMDGDKSVSAAFIQDTPPEGCDNPVAISIPFVQNGAGEYCWVTTTEIAYINSWNLDELTINGVDFTNTWSNNLPPAVNGEWVIHYVGSYAWSHFEAPAAKSAQSLTAGKDYFVYPNPFSTSFILDLGTDCEITSLRVVNQQGQVIDQYNASALDTDMLELGNTYPSGIYFIQIITRDEMQTLRIIKE